MTRKDMVKAIVEYRLDDLDPDTIKRYAGYFLATDYEHATYDEVLGEYTRLIGGL